jgi:hypothetical protein
MFTVFAVDGILQLAADAVSPAQCHEALVKFVRFASFNI